MDGKLSTLGYLTEKELADVLPSEERMGKGAIAVIECVQDIPCNPCEAACPFQAISVGHPITLLPVLDEEKCIGCGSCIPKCSGLAIFVVDGSRSGPEGFVSMPYEYWPLPKIGDKVNCLNRSGRMMVQGEIAKVLVNQNSNHTAVVTVRVPKTYINEVRSIRLPDRRDSNG